jgi:ABC-type transporter Mla MlaB component
MRMLAIVVKVGIVAALKREPMGDFRMLRIHVENASHQRTLRLEGKLVDPWVDELVKVWANLSGCPPTERTTRVDLEAVSFVDESGKSMLSVLWRAGCELHGSGPFIASVIEEITANPIQ